MGSKKLNKNLEKVGKVCAYAIVIETENPKDLEDVLNKEFQKVAGHRNKIVFYRADPFGTLSEALKFLYPNSYTPKKEIKNKITQELLNELGISTNIEAMNSDGLVHLKGECGVCDDRRKLKRYFKKNKVQQ